MYHFEYASRKDRKPIRDNIIKLIRLVQKDLKNVFTFQYKFEGSDSLNLVTYDPMTNTGFDFDVNLIPNDDDERYSPEELKKLLMNSFNKFASKFGFDYCEDSTRVFTIKVKDRVNSRILYSCDFAIVYDYEDNNGYWNQSIIYHNKNQGTYEWQQQPDSYYEYFERMDKIKKFGYWQEFREHYLEKKNNNSNKNKRSRALRIESVNEIHTKYCKNR